MASSSPTGGAPVTEERDPPRRSKKVECGYCDCVLDSEGEIIVMGKRAKEFRAARENDETRINRITALEAEVTDLKTKLAERAPATTSVPTPAGRKSVLDTLVPTGR
jgi:hypothetical protein